MKNVLFLAMIREDSYDMDTNVEDEIPMKADIQERTACVDGVSDVPA